jgi:hypothetical protein
MLTATDYFMAWSVYLLSAGIVLLALWRLSRPLWGWLRDLLRVVCAVVLLMPAAVDEGGAHLAPAVFVAGFELLAAPDGGMGPLVGVRLLLVAMLAVLAAWVLRLLWFWLVSGRRPRG